MSAGIAITMDFIKTALMVLLVVEIGSVVGVLRRIATTLEKR
ncbi:MAG TPA: hypothetical protein VFO62_10050 [Candidatus Binatia bacterium]|nr:hypothetical protein [Candidatus Binatia bacterium]